MSTFEWFVISGLIIIMIEILFFTWVIESRIDAVMNILQGKDD